MEDQSHFDTELQNGMAIDTCDENFSGAVLKALAAYPPKCRTCDDPRPRIPAGIQYEIRLKNRLRRQWQVTRDPALKAEVNRLQRSVARRLNLLRNNQCSATLESHYPEDQLMWRITKWVIRVSTPSPPGHNGGNRSVRVSESRSPCRQLGDSFSAGDRSFVPGSY